MFGVHWRGFCPCMLAHVGWKLIYTEALKNFEEEHSLSLHF